MGDGAGQIGSLWGDNSQATFEWTESMKDYNLDKLRIVEVELLDPQQCTTITQGVDSIIWCATDFNGNAPRAVSSLDLGLVFRAFANPTKGRVEIEGLSNILGGLKQSKMDTLRRNRLTMGSAEGGTPTSEAGSSPSSSSFDGPNDPTSVVLVSSSPDVWMNFETPFGEFNSLKRAGENMLRNDFPSLSHRILQMGFYEDLLVEEALDIKMEKEVVMVTQQGDEESVGEVSSSPFSREERGRRKINRRDAARAAVEALLDSSDELTVQVWTAEKGPI